MNTIETATLASPTAPWRHGRCPRNGPAPGSGRNHGTLDLISCRVSDELTRRSDRLLERRRKQAGFRDSDKTLDNFDFTFNPKINRSLVFDLATATFINKREDALFLVSGGTGKSRLAQAVGHAAIHRGYKVLYRETHVLLDELAESVADGTRSEYMASVATVRC